MVEPIIPLYGRYPSKEMKELFPIGLNDYRRECSDEMKTIFSDLTKYGGWRHNWVVLAEAEHELGLNITTEQLAALKEKEFIINFEAARAYEKKLKHDVMSYLKEYKDRVNEVFPGAGNILHMGATSCYITDHEELLSMRDGLGLIRKKIATLANKDLGGQTLYLFMDMDHELNERVGSIKARGAKGTTGTQASYLELFNGDHTKVISLDNLVATKLGFNDSYTITSQTYPRIVDYQVLSTLAVIAKGLSSINPDKQLDPYFEDIYRKATQAAHMASNQWLERSLDDSSERRIMISEAFYEMDYIIERIADSKGLKFVDDHVHLRSEQKKALDLIISKTASSIDKIFSFAEKYRGTICTAYTHGQFAQPETHGKRISLWDYNFVLALNDLQEIKYYEAAGSESEVLNAAVNSRLNQIAIAAAKMAIDIRFLQHDLELSEPFGKSQKGSSAMPYKQNPMKNERINGLSRNKIGSTDYGKLTNYDLLNTDAILELVLSVFVHDDEKQNGFRVYDGRSLETLGKFMPFLATENIMMHMTNIEGADRDDLHEKIRLASMEARENINNGRENNILEILNDKYGFNIDLSRRAELLDPETHVGRSREQVDDFGRLEVGPIREKYKESLGKEGNVQV